MNLNNNDLCVEFKQLSVTDKDKQYGLTVNTVGFQTIEPNSPCTLSGHQKAYFFNTTKSGVLNDKYRDIIPCLSQIIIT